MSDSDTILRSLTQADIKPYMVLMKPDTGYYWHGKWQEASYNTIVVTKVEPDRVHWMKWLSEDENSSWESFLEDVVGENIPLSLRQPNKSECDQTRIKSFYETLKSQIEDAEATLMKLWAASDALKSHL